MSKYLVKHAGFVAGGEGLFLIKHPLLCLADSRETHALYDHHALGLFLGGFEAAWPRTWPVCAWVSIYLVVHHRLICLGTRHDSC